MSNPNVRPRELTQAQLLLENKFPVAYLSDPDRLRADHQARVPVEYVVQQLKDLDMKEAPAVYIPKDLTVDDGFRKAKNPKLAYTVKACPEARRRSRAGVLAAAAMYGHLPDRRLPAAWYTIPYTSKQEVKSESVKLTKAKGGVQETLGRIVKAYPKKGAPAVSNIRTEVLAASRACGWQPELMGEIEAYPLANEYAAEEEDGVGTQRDGLTINAHADNGYPTCGKWNTPGASSMVMGLAREMRRQLENAPRAGGVAAVYEKWQKDLPHLVLVRGKCKEDYYSLEKIDKAMMRFYNVIPRQLLLICQQVTQPWSQRVFTCDNAPPGATRVNTAQKISFAHGGADTFMKRLSREVGAEGVAYRHAGDDTYFVVAFPTQGAGMYTVEFKLDCSNFDLTQRKELREPIIELLAATMRVSDHVAADLFEVVSKNRLTNVCSTVVREMEHGGPSGMVLQSTINDILMEVLCARLEKWVFEWSVKHRFRIGDCSRRQEAATGVSMDPVYDSDEEEFTYVPPFNDVPHDHRTALAKVAEFDHGRAFEFPCPVWGVGYNELFAADLCTKEDRTKIPWWTPDGGFKNADRVMQARGDLSYNGTGVHKYKNAVGMLLDDLPVEIKAKGAELGFEVKLEGVRVHYTGGITSYAPQSLRVNPEPVLAQSGFDFLGYELYPVNASGEGNAPIGGYYRQPASPSEREVLYNLNHEVEYRAFAQMARWLPRMVYPSKFHESKRQFLIEDAARLASVVLSMGLPGRQYATGFTELTQYVSRNLSEAIAQFGELDIDPAALCREAAGVDEDDRTASLRGLLRALGDLPKIWLAPKAIPVGTPLELGIASWADLVEEEEEQAGIRRPHALVQPPRNAKAVRAPTLPLAHGVSGANDGRPPPVARWAPNKPARPRREMTIGESSARTRRRDGDVGRAYDALLESSGPAWDEEDEFDVAGRGYSDDDE